MRSSATTAPDDCDAWGRAIARMWTTLDAVRRMGDNARQAACTKHSYAEMALVWRQLIREPIDDSIRGSHYAA